MSYVKLEKLNRFNWEVFIKLEVASEQSAYITSNLYAIAQSYFEPSELYGIYYKNLPVGFLVLNKWNSIYWLSHIMIDKNWQGQGIGLSVLENIKTMLASRNDFHELRASIASGNKQAQKLFTKAGFKIMNPTDEWEVMYSYNREK
jgi:RimJ/RimL family protein N-acetyltransferase